MRRLRSLPLLLALVAFVATGLAVSPAPRAAAGPKHGADKWALIVGVDQYRGRIKDLSGSVGDARDLREVLIRNGWPADHIRVLTDEQATGAAIREGFRWLQARANDNSFSVFHYSGHVKQLSGDKDRDGEAVDEFLWPVDNAYISDAELSGAMRQLRGWSWINLAGCEGAGLNDGMHAFNRFVTASSMEPEKSYEAPEWRNSIYGGLLFEYSMMQRQGDTNGDGRISIQEGFEFANRHAPQLTAKQSKGPQHPYRAGGDGTEWFLDTPAPAPPPRAEPQPQPRPEPERPPPPPCQRNCEPGDDPSR